MSEPPFPLEPDGAAFDAWTSACVAFVRDYLLSLPNQPASDADAAEPLRSGLREPAPESGRPMDELLARLRPAVLASFNTAGPGYLAFIPGGGVYAAALADYVALSVNRYVGVAKTAPALVEIEATVIAWLAELMGYPADARGLLTSGGSMSNLIAIITARAARLPEDFLRGILYFSEETHASVAKAARLAGFPERNLRRLPVDARYRLEPAALERAVTEDKERGATPFLIVANVGTTNTGALDPVPAIVDIARRQGLWVHADAAYGGFFRLCAEGAARTQGIDGCDSITLDPHKGLFLPYGTGCLLVRDGEALRRAHQGDAAYLRDVAPDADQVNFTDLSPELSRDFRGLRIWLPVQLHGLAAFRRQLEEKLELTRLAYAELAADARFELLDEPQLSVVAFRLRVPAGAGEGADEESDRVNAELLRRVNARGRVFLSSTVLGGRTTLRICVLSFRTHRERLLEAIATLQEEAGRLGRGTGAK
ncbi:MAG: aminotransferase class V-fold PLP-dependent enzyme [Planctomycetes bacterium]|nr:aminotransferase class V-fold PLP-dependent enzyme [Planctomycetota bacterium]